MAPGNQPGNPTTAPRVVKPHFIPLDDEIPPSHQSQIISNMKMNISNFIYALETYVIASIEIQIHYEANAATKPIIGTAE